MTKKARIYNEVQTFYSVNEWENQTDTCKKNKTIPPSYITYKNKLKTDRLKRKTQKHKTPRKRTQAVNSENFLRNIF